MGVQGVDQSKDFTKQSLKKIKANIALAPIPSDLRERLEQMVSQLEMSRLTESFLTDFQRTNHYVEWAISLPWQKETKDNLDLNYARKVLEESHYGLDQIKQRILEYLSVLILQKKRGQSGSIRAPILCFVGLVGTGKTTIAQAIAKALGRKFIRIPFGGLGDPFYLRGQSRFHPYAEPGHIIKGLKTAGAKNPVILLDEIDRVADDALNTIMGVLVELLDPEQNWQFIDHFLDYPFDLSQALFVTTANNTNRIATAVLDRIEPIQMPSYTDQEKIVIGKNYLFPKSLAEASLKPEELRISEECWPLIVRPLGFDAGVRTLKRNIEGMVRKVAMLIVEKKAEKIIITKENIKKFLPEW